MELHKNFYRKKLIFLAAVLCMFIFTGCSAKAGNQIDSTAPSVTVQTECQPMSKSTDDTAVKARTVDVPEKNESVSVSFPEIVEVRHNIEKSTNDVPEKRTGTEIDRSKVTSSIANIDTDSENKAASTDSEKYNPKTSTSKVNSGKDSENKAASTDSEKDNPKTSTSKVNSDTDSKTNSSSSDKTKSEKDSDKEETKIATKTPPKEYHIKVKHIAQHKDMPTGCEIVSARMVLEYYGKNITYEHMLSRIPTANLKTTKDGKLYGKTPYQAFLGDPKKNSGFGCYPPVIMEMVANYNYNDLYTESTCKLPLDFIAKTYLPQDIPVLVWATIGMGNSYLTNSWYVEGDDGKPTNQKYTWRAEEHCLVLTGYDEKYYYFSDPLSYQDVTKYEKSLVEKRYKEIGYNSMIIRKYE